MIKLDIKCDHVNAKGDKIKKVDFIKDMQIQLWYL